MSEWTIEKTMQTLRAKGKPGSAKIYARHRVVEESFGVSYADLGAIVKAIKRDHALALALWETGIHDARILATHIADPEALTRAQIDAWLRGATNYIVVDAVSMLAAKSPNALAWAAKWTTSKGEWETSAGWTTLAALAQGGRLGAADARSFVARIEHEIATAPNRTRHAMNQALIAIGGNVDELREAALATAARIGKVVVDHGETGCKTPDAASYIAKMVAHRAKKKAPAKPARAKR